MMLRCPNCGEANPERARFCLRCGTPLEAAPPPPETRKTVTVVFSDVTGSTSLGERLDPESLSRVMARYFDAMRTVLERHGATVQKFIGDAVMAVFGIPVVHEDDAVRAVRAAAEFHSALDTLNAELARNWGVTLTTRTGVNTGEVVAGNPQVGSALVVGDAVNVAARLEQAAGPGEVLLGRPTWQLVRDAATVEPLAPLSLAGKTGGVPAYRLVAVQPGTPGHRRRADAAMVGREHERELLEWTWQRVLRDRTCHLVTVLGTAGVGKSRLVAETLGQVEGQPMVLIGRCLPYGQGITFWPVAEIVRQAAGMTEDDPPAAVRAKLDALLAGTDHGDLVAARIAQLIGLEAATVPAEEAAWAVRKLLEALAGRQPLVMVFDDLHWAEPTLLDVIEHAADWSREVPMLLVAIARPELLEQRPRWAGGKLNATSMLLEPLSARESSELLRRLLGGAEAAEPVQAQITRLAEGNPLYLEETLAMLLEDGRLRKDDGRWVASGDPAAITVPPTIQALLAARLDRLGPEDRDMLERASVIGQIFSRDAVTELAPPERRPDVPARLLDLVRQDFLRATHSGFPGEDNYQFRHLLIRDAAYEALPKRNRAELHERFATWLETARGERTREYEEIIGYHLEQAWRYLAELSPLVGGGGRLATRAAERLAAAGRRALDRGDMPAAVNLLSRAAALLPTQDPARLALAPALASALRSTGEFGRASAVLADVAEHGDGPVDRRLAAYAVLERIRLRARTAPEGWSEEARREAERLIAVFQELGDDRGLAKAWSLLAETLWTWRQVASSEEAVQRAIELARRAGDEQEETEALGDFAVSAVQGPTPVPDAIRRCHDILAKAKGRRRLEGRVLLALADLEAMQGDVDEARRLLDRSRTIFSDLGMRLALAGMSETVAAVELRAGDPAAAERPLRQGYETLERMGERSRRSRVAAMLAHTLLAQDRPDEAEQFIAASEEQAAIDDFSTRIVSGAARAGLLARRGQVKQAEALARGVVALAGETDDLNLQGDALLHLAAVLRAAGRPDAAAAATADAIGCYERKGNTLSMARARAALAGRS